MPGVVVLNPATVDGYGNPISVTRDETIGANRLLTSSQIVEPLPEPVNVEETVVVDFYRQGVDGETTYGIAIDRDNDSGLFKHSTESDGYVHIVGAAGILIKRKNSDIWGVIYGTILSIDESEATIGWLQIGALHAADTNVFADRYASATFPIAVNTTVDGGDYTKITAAYKETTSDINSSTPISSNIGDITPAVGDIIARAQRTSGSGTADVHFSIWYYVG